MSEGLVALAAGGTGGHMFPAEALARELLRRGWRVALVTDRRGQAFGDALAGVALHRIHAGRLGGGLAGKVAGLAELALGTIGATRLLRSLAPAVTVGFGGYPSLPTMLAAGRLRIPTLVHEQNARLGRANRLVAPRAWRIATSFPEVSGVRPADRERVVETGNPVRPAVAALRGTAYKPPEGDAPIHLLITGGSQGARILSAVVPAALGRLPAELRRRLVVVQQARPEDVDSVRRMHASSEIAAEVAAFFDDIPAQLARAHLVICRAGASTVAELQVMGRPALLVPYRHAAEDHQSANARAVAAKGAGWILEETAFSPALLAERIATLVAAPLQLAAAAAAAHRLGRPDAAVRLADLAIAAAGGGNGATRQEHAA